MFIRPAKPEDAAAIAAINTLAWQAYRGIVPDDALDAMSPDDPRSITRNEEYIKNLPATDLVLVYKDEGRVVGFIDLRYDLEEKRREMELKRLYVHPTHWRHGIGGLLMQTAVGHLQKQGWPGLYVWTLKASTHSRNFYEKRGGKLVINSEKTFTRPGYSLPLVQYIWPTPESYIP